MKYSKLIGFALCALLAACTAEPPHQPSQIVLEAWIDAGSEPVVLIHKSYILADAPDTVKTLEEIVEGQLIPFGRVNVSDGENDVVLTGRLDTMYLPPYTYTTVDMDGEVGRTYTVTATYKDLEAHATTTIPPVAKFDSLAITTNTMGTKNIHGYLHTDTVGESYYALFIRKKGTKQYRLCPYGVFNGQDAENGLIDMKVYNPLVKESDLISRSFYFEQGDSAMYQLKLARVDYTTYLFWKQYSEQVITSGIIFVPVYTNIPGNVIGGHGHFSGFGSTIYRFDLLKDTTYKY